MTTRASLLAALIEVRKRICPYPGSTCDCKWGLDKDSRYLGEQTGCCELSFVISYLQQGIWDVDE